MENSISIEKFLTDEMNLSQKEIALYLNLIKYDALTILELAEISGINRATTHVNVENLTQKGLVTQMKKGRGSRRLIMAEPADKLSVIFTERRAKLEAAESQLGFITKELTNLKKEYKTNENIEIRRYKGKDEVRLIYNEVLKSKEIRSYLNCKELSKVFPGNINKFLEAHKKNQTMQIWEIMEKSEEAKEYAKQMPTERYYFRLATEQLNLASLDYILFDGKIAVIELDTTVEISGIVFENKNFYENANAIHKFVWNFLPAHKL
jgi:predicted transcriptional regulator